MAYSHSLMIHPEALEGEGFTHNNGTVGVKLKMAGNDIVIFNHEEDYLEPEEILTGQDIVDALRKAANELAKHLRKEAKA